MNERTILIVTGLLMLAAILIPVPRRTRAVLWCVMLGLIVTFWVGVSLGFFTPIL